MGTAESDRAKEFSGPSNRRYGIGSFMAGSQIIWLLFALSVNVCYVAPNSPLVSAEL